MTETVRTPISSRPGTNDYYALYCYHMATAHPASTALMGALVMVVVAWMVRGRGWYQYSVGHDDNPDGRSQQEEHLEYLVEHRAGCPDAATVQGGHNRGVC